MRWWPEPTAGDIAWCHFPDHVHPKPKPRPGLITLTKEDDEGRLFVSVAYGTSQKTDRLYSGEFCITKSEHPAAYASAGLSYDTKFDLSKVLELPYNDDYFSVPPHAPHGQNPKYRGVIARDEAIHCGRRVKAWIATARHVASSSRLKAAPRNDEVGWRQGPS
jgi:hypothetical protein